MAVFVDAKAQFIKVRTIFCEIRDECAGSETYVGLGSH